MPTTVQTRSHGNIVYLFPSSMTAQGDILQPSQADAGRLSTHESSVANGLGDTTRFESEHSAVGFPCLIPL